jgi:Leu/Phe-tRNA-protein transferase/Tfp pilus assembly protein PilF
MSRKRYSFFAKGLGLHQKGSLDEAIAAYTEAIWIDPRHVQAYNNRGCIYDDKGLFDLAIADLAEAIRIDPCYADAYYNRGFVYQSRGLLDLAIKDYTDAIRINPEYIGAFYNRGNIYRDKGLFDSAIKDYTDVIRINPDEANALNARGKMYCRKGLTGSALDDFTRMVRIRYPGEAPERLIKAANQNERPAGLRFAAALLASGFYIDILGDSRNPCIIKPHSVSERCLLFFHNLHAGKTIRRHLDKMAGRYTLCFDTDFDAVLRRCVEKHDDVIFTPDFQRYFKELKSGGGPARPVSFSLYKDGKLAAGDIGVQTGRVYTSYSGYHDEPSAGTVQLILTARYLEEKGFAFWDFGPAMTLGYKTRLGAKVVSREEFISLYTQAAK